ncbi:MAG: DUF2235 domain-containing protein [Alphaproteobacteria bacterium]|nr:DUF2235 domain-containing protein [Alphaproteobacteria bacterium]
MSKNILIFSDGTGQAGGVRVEQNLSNIYKLYRATKTGADSPIDPQKQIAFYDAGLGSEQYAGAFWQHPVQSIKRYLSLGLGQGININIIDCYEAIIKNYELGDRVYLFGFSRGAYTVRCVANVMNLCGIPTTDGAGNPVPRYGKALRSIAKEAVTKVYEHGGSKDRAKYELEREEQAKKFRQKYSSGGLGVNGEEQGNVAPYFIGVFDTVAALGAPVHKKILVYGLVTLFICILSYVISSFWDYNFVSVLLLFSSFAIIFNFVMVLLERFKFIADYPKKGDFKWHIVSWQAKFYDRFLDSSVRFARHALSIDEARKDFPRVAWGVFGDSSPREENEPEWIKQIWFAGNHSDVGGSYSESEARLSDIPLQWMIDEIKSVPHTILINQSLLNLYPAASGIQHCEISAFKDIWPSWWPNKLKFSWPAELRPIKPEQFAFHSTVEERFKLEKVNIHGLSRPYRPENLRDHPKFSKYYQI